MRLGEVGGSGSGRWRLRAEAARGEPGERPGRCARLKHRDRPSRIHGIRVVADIEALAPYDILGEGARGQEYKTSGAIP